jgi:hypothetical protein
MFRSRPLQVLLLLTCCVTPVYTTEPRGARGAGTVTCESYLLAVHAPKERSSVETAAEAREWVRGYFAGRNEESNDLTRSVGGSLSNENFERLLIEQCREEHGSFSVNFAADRLYRKLKEKRL